MLGSFSENFRANLPSPLVPGTDFSELTGLPNLSKPTRMPALGFTLTLLWAYFTFNMDTLSILPVYLMNSL